MNHLNEEQLIDVLMDEPRQPALDEHLATCEQCSEELNLLRDGLNLAQEVEPRVPLMVRPHLSHIQYKRRMNATRFTWLAAAAMLMLGVLGFRVEVGDGRMSMEFALFSGGTDAATAQRVEQLESELAMAVQVLEFQSETVQNQLDEFYNAFHQERQRDIETFNVLLRDEMQNRDLRNQQYLINAETQLMERIRAQKVTGALQ